MANDIKTARCKVQCIERTELPQYWQETDPETNLQVGKTGAVTPPTEQFPAGRCARSFKFGGSFPQTGVAENEKFWSASPSLEFRTTVENAAVDFEVGKHYYVDFAPAD